MNKRLKNGAVFGADKIQSVRYSLTELRRSLKSSLWCKTSSSQRGTRKDDDEALVSDVEIAQQWGAIDKLPSFDRLKAPLFDKEGEGKVLAKLLVSKSNQAKITIINDISGIVKPGRMTLLLGFPGRRKTTLLKALSGNLDKSLKAISAKGQKTTLQTDHVLKVLGLYVYAVIMAGDEMRIGISGGEKRRLTTGEMVVGPTKALFMDEISNGLDSSTAYQIVACL
ncbi:hypothetical protein Patl1_24542 [Pistacia atlantica]|uniref:Uncharacterized protein n=1 Tax=Pistacia atlantica TaxID=434234 RepID=A0ACC0ZZV8_9ROSI|nr:hypothetical protein Patl1_24542 [Pistacia atlantica]